MKDNNFFDELETKDNKPMTDEEVEAMAKALGGMVNNYQVDKKNVYQIVAIILVVLGIIGSLVMSISLESPMILFVGGFVSFISVLFLYGLGTLINEVRIVNKQLARKNNKK